MVMVLKAMFREAIGEELVLWETRINQSLVQDSVADDRMGMDGLLRGTVFGEDVSQKL